MVKECFRKAGIFAGAVFILLGIFLFSCWLESSYGTQERSPGQAEGRNGGQEAAPGAEASSTPEAHAFLSVLPVSGAQNEADFISWWQSPADGKYYLFLPSFADPSSLRLILNGADEVTIDGRVCRDGALTALPEGEHKITCPDVSPSSPETGPLKEETLVVLQSAGTNTLFVTTDSGSLDYLHASKEHFEPGAVSVYDEKGTNLYAGRYEFLKGRGNASWLSNDKRSFQLRFQERIGLFGMEASRKWNLISNCFDPSLLRNHITYELADRIGLAYSPDSVFVDWYANGEYQGSYLLCERVEVDKNRVAVRDLEEETALVNKTDRLYDFPAVTLGEPGSRGSLKAFDIPDDPSDITGGYLLEMELNTEAEPRYSEEPSGFITNRGQAVVIASPAYASLAQAQYISSLYQEMEDAVMDSGGWNRDTLRYYAQYIDVDSFARKYMIEEISKNMDAQYTSQYFYKPNNKISRKFYAGPVWDYDMAWGCSGVRAGVDLEDPETFYANQYTYEGTLWYGLYQQETFVSYVKRTFHETVRPQLELIAYREIDSLSARLEKSALLNDYRWNLTENACREEKEAAYRQAVEQLKDFAGSRCQFLIREWDG